MADQSIEAARQWVTQCERRRDDALSEFLDAKDTLEAAENECSLANRELIHALEEATQEKEARDGTD